MDNIIDYQQEMNWVESEYLNIDEGYFILAIKENSDFSNALPLCYYKEGEIEYGEIDYDEISKILVGNRNDNILNRFYNHEPFLIAGKIDPNGRRRNEYEPDSFVFAQRVYSIERYKDDFLFEIFKGKINVANSTIIINNENLRQLIIESYIVNQRPILIWDKSFIYGPFKIVSSEETNIYKVEKYKTYTTCQMTYDNSLVFQPSIDKTNNIERFFIFNDQLKILLNKGDAIDFITDEGLLKWVQQLDSTHNKNDIEENEKVLNKLTKWINNPDIDKMTERYNRLIGILNKTNKYKEALNNFFITLPQATQMQELITQLEEKKLEIENEINKLTSDKDKLEFEKSKLENDRKEEEQRLSIISQKTEEAKKSLEENIENQLKDKKKQLEELENILKEEKEKKNDELINIKNEISVRTKDKEELEKVISRLNDDFISSQKEAHQKLADLVKAKTHLEFIRGRRFGEDEKSEYQYDKFISKRKNFESYSALRTKLIDIFNKQERNYEQHFIDNILISVHQNLLTIFAGFPGTGKTSLARILCNALGTQKRVFEIPVGRGWTSQKELLGFHNPLSGKFVEAHKGLYKLLKDLDYEWKHDNLYSTSPLAYIILDEANLSPIEHYWSTFINDTDSIALPNKPLIIDLGQEGKIEHANAIRFIGTINNDHTTEQLSPRILDRINLINIRPKENILIGKDFAVEDIEEIGLLFNECKNFFQLRDFSAPEFGENDRHKAQMDKYREIKEIFINDLKLFISPRIDLAIDRYCRAATICMSEKFRPIDYCIAQRILPLINLYGDESTVKAIDKLLAKFDEFSLPNSVSKEILENIKEIGSKSGYTKDNFNYFLTLSNC